MKTIRFVMLGLLAAGSASYLFAGQSTTTSTTVVETGLDGARLWAQNCTRCHNSRPPNTYSGAQWDVIVHHMRVRAYLTVNESHAIADFLKDHD